MSRILVDTSAWIEFFDRESSALTDWLAEAVRRGNACAHGLIRAELLSGCRTDKEYHRLASRFSALTLLPDPADLWERVARARYRLARRRVQAAVADLIIALIAEENRMPLLTLDGDYRLFQKVINLQLAEPGIAA